MAKHKPSSLWLSHDTQAPQWTWGPVGARPFGAQGSTQYGNNIGFLGARLGPGHRPSLLHSVLCIFCSPPSPQTREKWRCRRGSRTEKPKLSFPEQARGNGKLSPLLHKSQGPLRLTSSRSMSCQPISLGGRPVPALPASESCEHPLQCADLMSVIALCTPCLLRPVFPQSSTAYAGSSLCHCSYEAFPWGARSRMIPGRGSSSEAFWTLPPTCLSCSVLSWG